MTIAVPQSPDDSRKVVRSVDADGNLVFSQVGIQEIDFFARFGAKVYSSTQNTIGIGTQAYTTDTVADKIKVGDDVQITSLDDPVCYQYGTVVANDTTNEPAQLTIVVNDVSPLSGTYSNWEIQVIARPKAWLEVDVSTTSIDPTTDGPFTLTVNADKMFPVGGTVLLRAITAPHIAVLAGVNNYSGTTLQLRKVSTTATVSTSYDSWDVALIDAPPRDLPFLSIVGLTVTPNASGTPWPVTINPGSVMDSTNTVRLTLTDELVKRLAATWAAGTNQGGIVTVLQAGTISSAGTTVTGVGTSFESNFANIVALDDYIDSGGATPGHNPRITSDSQVSIVDTVTSDTVLDTSPAFSPSLSGDTFYRNGVKESTEYGGTWFVCLIRNDSDGSIDACFSAGTVSGAPDLPSGYSMYRVIAAIADNTTLETEMHVHDANQPYISGNETILTWSTPDQKSNGARQLAAGTAISMALAGVTHEVSVVTQMSITADGSGLMLENDEASPGNNMYYGTDGAGVKGWYPS